MEDLLREMIDELRALNSKLDAIDDKLPIIAPMYNLDDVHEKIGETTDELLGPLRYNLSDIHSKLDEVIGSISSLETTIDLK